MGGKKILGLVMTPSVALISRAKVKREEALLLRFVAVFTLLVSLSVGHSPSMDG